MVKAENVIVTYNYVHPTSLINHNKELNEYFRTNIKHDGLSKRYEVVTRY